MFHVAIDPAGTRRTLKVAIENTTARPVALDLPDRCPNGIVELDGLGPGYDYYDACAKGACARIGSPVHFALGPRETRVIAETTINLDGTGSCARPLSPGKYVVRAVVPAGVSACTDEAILDVASSPSPLPAPPAPARSPAVSSDPYACTGPGECVLSCPQAPGCCGWPCGCRHAINRAHVAAFEATYPSTCTRAPNCPIVGCSFDPGVSAACRNGRCIAASGVGF